MLYFAQNSLAVHRGEVLGLAGESGRGRLLKPRAAVFAGAAVFHDRC